MKGVTLAKKYGRPSTPVPVGSRQERLKKLSEALDKEARVQRDDSDTLQRFGCHMLDRGWLVKAWSLRARAFKRRSMARRMFDLSVRLADYVAGCEYLDTMMVDGKTLEEVEKEEAAQGTLDRSRLAAVGADADTDCN